MPFFWIPASCPSAWQQATCSAPHRESPSLARDVLSLSGINSLQPRELRLSSQAHLLPHLSCHLCWPGRKSTAPDGGPGTPNKLCLQWWWSWFCCHTEWHWATWIYRCSGAERSPSQHTGAPQFTGGGTYLCMGLWQPSRSLPLPYNCSGTAGKIHKLSLPLTPSKRKRLSSPGSEKPQILTCSEKTSNITDTALPSSAWRCELGLPDLK